MFVDPVAMKALQNVITELETLLATTPVGEDRTDRRLELIRAAKVLMNDIIKRAARVQ